MKIKLIIKTVVTDEKEIAAWATREGILEAEMQTKLLRTGKITLRRTPGSVTTYELKLIEGKEKCACGGDKKFTYHSEYECRNEFLGILKA